MQLYVVNFIPLLGSLYIFLVLNTPITRSIIFNYLQPLVQTIVFSATYSQRGLVSTRPCWE